MLIQKMRYLFLIFVLVLGLSAYGFQSTSTNSGTIEIEVKNIKNEDGKILISLFKGAEGFPSNGKAAYKTVQKSIKGNSIVVKFENLPYGQYAVALLHDENGNMKMDTNMFGIPKEGYAFSQNYKPTMRSPKFSEASFTLNKPSVKQVLNMIY
ncbi:MAG: DUF2141 domain-containing protein [Bernardetiaceae bacterium]|nr:DUF2141 domain-containing protein [Bernardetiaceae bacterium]